MWTEGQRQIAREQQPGITAPIIGASKMSHLDDAVAALKVRNVLDLRTLFLRYFLADAWRWAYTPPKRSMAMPHFFRFRTARLTNTQLRQFPKPARTFGFAGGVVVGTVAAAAILGGGTNRNVLA